MKEHDTANEQVIDQWTYQLEALLLQIAATAQQNNKQYYIGGGFAIDLTFGGLSRVHEDIDFHPMEEDTQWWKDWFVSQGYIVSKEPDMEDYPYAFLLTNEKHDYFADVYPVKVTQDGTISVTVTTTYKGRPWWQNKSWNEVKHISYKGQTINVENYASVLKQKEGHYTWHGGTLEGKHLYDFQRAGVEPREDSLSPRQRNLPSPQLYLHQRRWAKRLVATSAAPQSLLPPGTRSPVAFRRNSCRRTPCPGNRFPTG